MKNILVLCTGNSCRSQMAHGYLNQFAANQANIYSAGIETHGINPGAAAIMKEDGIDISDIRLTMWMSMQMSILIILLPFVIMQ